MDPPNDLPDLIEDLEVNIDELTSTLRPLLSTPIHTTASTLPLLDKAKLYIHTAYAIESLLFSSLQASGVDAKAHAVFAELARLKGYFSKIKEVEERGSGAGLKPKTKLDRSAAARFVKAGLAGNDRYDRERAEKAAKERARAAIRATRINKKFDDEGEEVEVTPTKRTIAEVEEAGQDNGLEGLADSSIVGAGTPDVSTARGQHKPHNKRENRAETVQTADGMRIALPSRSSSKKERRKEKKAKRAKNG